MVPQLDTMHNYEQSYTDIEDVEDDPRQSISDLLDSDPESELHYSNLEVEDEQTDGNLPSTRLATVSSMLLQHNEDTLRIFEATEAEVEELKQYVKALEEDKEILEAKIGRLQAQVLEATHTASSIQIRLQDEVNERSHERLALVRRLAAETRRASENNSLQMRRISELEIELQHSRTNVDAGTADEGLQAQNAGFQEQIEALERQLEVLRREKTALSRKMGTSSKGAPANAALHKQYVDELNKQNLQLLRRSEEREASARAQAAQQASQLQQTVRGLEQENASLEWRLRQQQNKTAELRESRQPGGQFEAAFERDLIQARAEVKRLQERVQEQQSAIEQKEQTILEYAHDYSDVADSQIPEDLAPSQEEFDGLEPQSAEAGESKEEDDAAFSASGIDEPVQGQPQFELEETLRLQYRELEDMNRGLQEQNTKWRKLFKRFMQRATDVQRKDASKHQVKKGFKDLHKIVKEGELQGL